MRLRRLSPTRKKSKKWIHELSFCHFGPFSFSTREQKQMRRTYIKCAGHSLLEYEKVRRVEDVEEFNLYHTEVKVDLTLPFGNAYWGRGAPSNSLFPNLAELAHRLLSIRPLVAATESTFSLMKLITGTQRQSLSMEARNAELYLRFNGPLSSLKAKRLTFTQNIEVYEP